MRRNELTFTKKENNSTTMEHAKMTKWLHYCGMEGVWETNVIFWWHGNNKKRFRSID